MVMVMVTPKVDVITVRDGKGVATHAFDDVATALAGARRMSVRKLAWLERPRFGRTPTARVDYDTAK